jgi:hypothetical protein
MMGAGSSDQCEQIVTRQRLAAGKDQHRTAKAGKLIDESQALFGRQFFRRRFIENIQSPAMNATQIAAGGGFPIDASELRLHHTGL